MEHDETLAIARTAVNRSRGALFEDAGRGYSSTVAKTASRSAPTATGRGLTSMGPTRKGARGLVKAQGRGRRSSQSQLPVLTCKRVMKSWKSLL
jgi:hypothetical protein